MQSNSKRVRTQMHVAAFGFLASGCVSSVEIEEPTQQDFHSTKPLELAEPIPLVVKLSQIADPLTFKASYGELDITQYFKPTETGLLAASPEEYCAGTSVEKELDFAVEAEFQLGKPQSITFKKETRDLIHIISPSYVVSITRTLNANKVDVNVLFPVNIQNHSFDWIELAVAPVEPNIKIDDNPLGIPAIFKLVDASGSIDFSVTQEAGSLSEVGTIILSAPCFDHREETINFGS